jgi:hypothetical protein
MSTTTPNPPACSLALERMRRHREASALRPPMLHTQRRFSQCQMRIFFQELNHNAVRYLNEAIKRIGLQTNSPIHNEELWYLAQDIWVRSGLMVMDDEAVNRYLVFKDEYRCYKDRLDQLHHIAERKSASGDDSPISGSSPPRLHMSGPSSVPDIRAKFPQG